MLLAQTSPQIHYFDSDVPLQTLQLEQKPMTFHHSFDIYLKDSNAYANTYFSRYFE